MSSLSDLKRALGLACVVALVFLIGATSASAETLMMPDRDLERGTSEVVWGLTTLPNNSMFSIDFGDGSAPTAFALLTTAGERSYIHVNHVYALAGTFTATLTVDPVSGPNETATVVVRVFDRPTLSDAEKRGLDVNRAIENGLRWLWTQESSRTSFDTQPLAFWTNQSFTALVVLAFENHGYKVPNSDDPPVGIYPKYVVQRGLNRVFNGLSSQALVLQTNLNPCVGPGIEPGTSNPATTCVGYEDFSNSVGYSTAIASLPISGSSALTRHVTTGVANGKTYAETLQRILNAVSYNQIDTGQPNRGGWAYGAANNSGGSSDSSVVGWDLLAIFDAVAAGAVMPNDATHTDLVKTEFGAPGNALDGHRNDTDGSFDYTANTSETANDFVGKNLAKTAIGLQALFYVGDVGTSFPRVALTVTEIDKWWITSGGNEAPPAGAAYACSGNGKYNKGCGYGMFNAFKGLKLHGVNTLPDVNRPAGSFGDPDDWYADYLDWLIANQSLPTDPAGGSWPGMRFSASHGDNTSGAAALAELILSPVALIAPDPTLFSSVGLSPQTDTNPVSTPHTVIAFVQATGGAPIAGATVGFTVLSGPNAGASGTCNPVGCVSGSDGKVNFTYNGGPTTGNDKIQANIGTLKSNIVDKFWIIPTSKCDANNDGKVDQTDLNIIRAANGQVASGPNDPRDGNGDGFINVADVRYCQLRQTPQ